MFYDPTGRETRIQPMGEEFGSVVYNNDIKCDANYFTRTLMEEKYKTKFKVEKNPIPKKIEPDSLLFESRFESGNLLKATRITDTYYELRSEDWLTSSPNLRLIPSATVFIVITLSLLISIIYTRSRLILHVLNINWFPWKLHRAITTGPILR